MSIKKIMILLLLVVAAFALNAQNGLAAYGYAKQFVMSGPSTIMVAEPLPGVPINIDFWVRFSNQPNQAQRITVITDQNGRYELNLPLLHLNNINKMQISPGMGSIVGPPGKMFDPFIPPVRHDFYWGGNTGIFDPTLPPIKIFD